MDWTARAIEKGAGIVARVLTEQYLKSMKALGYASVYLVPDGYGPIPDNDRVYCHGEYGEQCVVDSDEAGLYTIHRGVCPLNGAGHNPARARRTNNSLERKE